MFGVYGFDDQAEPIRVAPLESILETTGSLDRSLIRQRIAGMAGAGGTRLAPALGAAIAALAASVAERKLLITLIDGALEDADAIEARALLATLPRRGIHLLPLYLGRRRRGRRGHPRALWPGDRLLVNGRVDAARARLPARGALLTPTILT
jgi:hypothetical protein